MVCRYSMLCDLRSAQASDPSHCDFSEYKQHVLEYDFSSYANAGPFSDLTHIVEFVQSLCKKYMYMYTYPTASKQVIAAPSFSTLHRVFGKQLPKVFML